MKHKRHLYVSVDGRCEKCGEPLGDRWHAHHKIRFIDAGATELFNAMALCERCHMKEHADDKAKKVAD